jgi:hypothetical protein
MNRYFDVDSDNMERPEHGTVNPTRRSQRTEKGTQMMTATHSSTRTSGSSAVAGLQQMGLATRQLLGQLWQSDRLLTGAGLLLLALLVPSLLGVWLDPRLITGAPRWLKPAKFAASTAVYSLTLAWVFMYLREWTRTRRLVGRITAAVLLLEVGLIDLQAWRGTTSHFNVGAPLDAIIFSVMGLAIFLQTLTSIAVAVALWRQPFANRALGWALRLGMTITIIGAFSAGLMVGPTQAQLQAARTTHQLAVAGAHTVGGPDGGPGLAGTGWSLEHGDLRVAHFVGLHALQVLPLVLLSLRRRTAAARARMMLAAGASYALLFVILLWQALRGQPLSHPDALTAGVFSAWLALTLAATAVAARGASPQSGDLATRS